MGKRRRRINNPKFATKFAKTRETYHRLRETVEGVVDNITETVEVIVEEIKEKLPNGLTFTISEETTQIVEPKLEVEKATVTTKKATTTTTTKKPATTKKKTTTTKKPPTTKKTTTTTRRRRTTKTKSDA